MDGEGVLVSRKSAELPPEIPTIQKVFTPKTITRHAGGNDVASTKTRVKAIRVNNETADWIEEQENFNRAIEDLYSHVQSGAISLSNGEISVNRGRLHRNEALEELGSMMKCLGGTLEDGIQAFYEGLESGSLTYIDGEIVVNECEYDLSRFIEACSEKCVDPQDMIDRMTQNIYNI